MLSRVLSVPWLRSVSVSTLAVRKMAKKCCDAQTQPKTRRLSAKRRWLAAHRLVQRTHARTLA